jgi:hypothetical protein
MRSIASFGSGMSVALFAGDETAARTRHPKKPKVISLAMDLTGDDSFMGECLSLK